MPECQLKMLKTNIINFLDYFMMNLHPRLQEESKENIPIGYVW